MNLLHSCLTLQQDPNDVWGEVITYIPTPEEIFLVVNSDTGNIYQATQEEVIEDIYIHKNLKGWMAIDVTDQGQELLNKANKVNILGDQ